MRAIQLYLGKNIPPVIQWRRLEFANRPNVLSTFWHTGRARQVYRLPLEEKGWTAFAV
jgi:hypothetical protein